MKDLARALNMSGAPVSFPWPALARHVKPRTHSVMVVLGRSGAGKSAWAFNWLVECDYPTLYLSLDTDLSDHAIRAVARSTSKTIEEIESGHDDDREAWAARWRPHVEALEWRIRFCDLSVSVETIGELISAETEYLGEIPKIVVVDNLMNLIHEESAGEYRRVLGELVRIAKREGTLVVALHHLRKKPPKRKDDVEEDESTPVSLDDALYAIDQEPKYVLGLWRPSDAVMTMGILKNRMGPADPHGHLKVSLRADMATMSIWDAGWAA